MNQKDTSRLRDLARQYKELAASQRMKELKKLWLDHNMYRGARPMITVETGTFSDDFVPGLMQCEDEEARNIEYAFLSRMANVTIFCDDSVLDAFFPVRYYAPFVPFGLHVLVDKPAEGGLGHHFVEQITDLGADFGKLKKSSFSFDRAGHDAYVTRLNELFGDILPVKTVGGCMYVCLTQDVVHIMGMENMFYALYDYPELFKRMIAMLADDYIDYFAFLKDNRLILPTTQSEFVAQGTYAFTEELKNDKSEYSSKDVWGFMDSQETVGMSEDMFEEFIFPAYYKVSRQMGLLSYGCCEPVSAHWDRCLHKYENLRRISVSPWCDEAFMGERLAGSGIIYHRKPNANFLSLGNLDEQGLRAATQKTMQCARGNKVEFTQRDVYAINGDVNKVRRYVEILREETEGKY